LIATTSSDELNILSCLVAKKLGVSHTIARIRNPEYEKQLRFMREELGLSMVINPERAAAREIARVLRFPAAM
jgi:trk system potassium uptake protein TrkA